MHHPDGANHHQQLGYVSSSAIMQICSMLVSDSIFRLPVGNPRRCGSHRHLLQGLFAGDAQGFHLLGKLAERLQQQVDLPAPGLPPIRDRTARHHVAAKHAVK